MDIYSSKTPLAKAVRVLVHDSAGTDCSMGAGVTLMERWINKNEEQLKENNISAEQLNSCLRLFKEILEKRKGVIDEFYLKVKNDFVE